VTPAFGERPKGVSNQNVTRELQGNQAANVPRIPGRSRPDTRFSPVRT
jgi:hypothetical protein